MWRYPFGRPVTPRAPSANAHKPLFVLGAYPSAVHVGWRPPPPYNKVRAIAVDDEPSPFWDGRDQLAVVDRWKNEIGFRDAWGTVFANSKFNGPCGQKLAQSLFSPLRISPSDACITTVLTPIAAAWVATRESQTRTIRGRHQSEHSPHSSRRIRVKARSFAKRCRSTGSVCATSSRRRGPT
jgi:hypothetical protein